MRKWVLWIHMHGMLLCASYLIIFGVSSLLFNHPFSWTKPKPAVVRWERSLPLERKPDKVKEAEAVAEQLGLIGWVLPWDTRRDTAGTLRFPLSRPGKEYTIEVPAGGGPVRVEERRTGLWQVLRQLHGLMAVRGSTFMKLWAQYTRLCTGMVVFAAVSGVYLFATRKSERIAGWFMLATAGIFAVLMMVCITLAG